MSGLRQIDNEVVLITGSTDGIGKQTALEMAGSGYHVILHGRDPGRGKAVLKEISDATGSKFLRYFNADFVSLENVRVMAQNILQEYQRLNILINNAGVFLNEKEVSADGYEMTFAVNHLAHFCLTLSLSDLLERSGSARIINVSSISHERAGDLSNLNANAGYDAHDAYAKSKLCNILFTYELAERLNSENITVNTLDPGSIDTKVLRAGWGRGDSPGSGAAKLIYLATSLALAGITGQYFVDNISAKSSDVSYSYLMRKALWEISEQITGSKLEKTLQ